MTIGQEKNCLPASIAWQITTNFLVVTFLYCNQQLNHKALQLKVSFDIKLKVINNQSQNLEKLDFFTMY